MTEEKARDKICKQVVVENTPGYRARYEIVPIYCVGSNCMMWRYKTNRQMGYDRNPDDLCLNSGYCGLGGKP